ncbi:3-oxoacyl-[acyl-carrier-protein] synthase III C-terminal domain-containing protein [Adonisia turfae]|uniref:3-oxoacyl-ACP synthase n=1 Tax=Adonisia turfae CCMR0081 TaxID=2292702 RepID=A0A6M0RI67_9CYAN|nr:3-oxoacyl-[acyl-carrier-protein] synthase III C-terminal domain-containing protein [Adonisia turfae]NEZ55849.1 3-oxoacyl-ACP synthase [Adonisia turfae CCMR0081]
MVMDAVGIRSLALCFPDTIRTNEYWQEKLSSEAPLSAPKRVRIKRPRQFTPSADGLDIWSRAVAPYLPDPFRGSVERRVIGAKESSRSLEYRVAQDALSAAGLVSDEVELLIVTSIFSESLGLQDASDLSQQLGLKAPAWNLEATCSSALVALQNASALVKANEHRHVLVVVSHVGSNVRADDDTLSWSLGDGAGAFVVSSLKPHQGILGTKMIHTAETRGAYIYEPAINAQDQPRICLRTGENASSLAETAVKFVRICCEGALTAAGVTLEQIKFFSFNTPSAWYANVCTQALEIDSNNTINLYPYYANIGPVSPIANLYHGMQNAKFQEDDLVLVYTTGAASTAAAMVIRWGDVKLGATPAPPLDEELTQHIATSYCEAAPQSSLSQVGYISRSKILNARPNQSRQILEIALLEWLATYLQRPISDFNAQESMAAYLDSLMVFTLRTHIEQHLQIQIPIEQFFNDSSLTQLIEFILKQLLLVDLIETESIAENKLSSEKTVSRKKLLF